MLSPASPSRGLPLAGSRAAPRKLPRLSAEPVLAVDAVAQGLCNDLQGVIGLDLRSAAM
eukprot:CAMPEP_0117667054 /NCGR_PEP_ID=MMETSP0804-20121206/10741_1 /TAXON_ID=1074897 /ORGANISM="Tetraselmis astigmatica, Strain CCMP880" /LENGTH=58 /DNA_ID=CAMNT_0005474713 /DNA_START=196 /DNA_END=372 /DNA_ORIENTATION=+